MPTTTAEKRLTSSAAILTVLTGAGAVTAFINAVVAFVAIEDSGSKAALIGADNELGYPSSALSLVIFAFATAVGVAVLAGARPPRGIWLAVLAVLSIGIIVEVWATVLSFTFLLLLQGLLMIAAVIWTTIRLLDRDGPSITLPLFLILGSTVGFFAAFRLTVDKVGIYVDPSAPLSCNASYLVQCGVNLRSWQGSLFGFPNPLLGVGGWIAPLAVGIMLLAGVKFSRWFWIALNLGVTGALALVIWLISQSIFVLGTLCPWCMVTWAVTIPTFWLITFYNLKVRNIPVPRTVAKLAAGAYGYVPLITVICYIIVALLAQVRLDIIHHL
ncbi:hypothetical protein BH09ACT1_BH09ACT1_08510 [soil metagenome]